MVKIRNKKELKLTRSKLRKNMPAPELVLWQAIRGDRLGVKFRRQFSIHNSILDFYSPSAKSAIELDGDSHYQDLTTTQNDKIRNETLRKLGIRVLRFTNRDVMENLDGVVTKIVTELPPLNLPLFREQGEKVI